MDIAIDKRSEKKKLKVKRKEFIDTVVMQASKKVQDTKLIVWARGEAQCIGNDSVGKMKNEKAKR